MAVLEWSPAHLGNFTSEGAFEALSPTWTSIYSIAQLILHIVELLRDLIRLLRLDAILTALRYAVLFQPIEPAELKLV